MLRCKQQDKEKKTADEIHLAEIYSAAALHLSCPGSAQVQWLKQVSYP